MHTDYHDYLISDQDISSDNSHWIKNMDNFLTRIEIANVAS